MDNPLVSVKMITYNHEPYIAQAIEGVLHQEMPFQSCRLPKRPYARDFFEYQKKLLI